jgi:hypothetical protein
MRNAGYIVLFGFWFCFAVCLTIGWCMNAYAATQCDFKAPYKAEVFRVGGIFVLPVGGVLGWFDIEDGE